VRWGVALLFALAPLIPLAVVGTHAIRRARDIWLRGLLLAGCVWLCLAEPIFVPLGVWALITWRTPATHAAILGWLAVIGAWFLARAIPVDFWPWVVSGWLCIGAFEVIVIVRQRFSPTTGRAPYGTLGQRTIAAGFLALLVPFSPWWGWPVLGVGLWLTGPSLGAVLSLALGLGVLYPLVWLAGLLLGPLALALMLKNRVGGADPLGWLPRGGSLDSIRARGNVFRLAWYLRREPGWAGRGPSTMSRDMQIYQHSTKVYVGEVSEPHCEPLHLCWEYGVFGVATVLIAGYRIGSGLQLGDPWSAAAVIGAGLSLTTFPLRVAPLGLVILAIWAHVAP
jgi:hypothetical protein